MEVITQALTVSFPKYLHQLPLPQTFAGFAELSTDEWVALAPLLVSIFALVFILIKVSLAACLYIMCVIARHPHPHLASSCMVTLISTLIRPQAVRPARGRVNRKVREGDHTSASWTEKSQEHRTWFRFPPLCWKSPLFFLTPTANTCDWVHR